MSTLIRCEHCNVLIVIIPMEVKKDNGMKTITSNLVPVYEHMRKFHPEIWTTELTQEYEKWKEGKIA